MSQFFVSCFFDSSILVAISVVLFRARIRDIIAGKRWMQIAMYTAALLMTGVLSCFQLSTLEAQESSTTKVETADSDEVEMTAEQFANLPPLICGTTVSGKVLLPEGQACSDAKVYLLARPDGSYTLPTTPLVTESDKNGFFEFLETPTGGYSIWAETETMTSQFKMLRARRLTVEQSPATSQPIKLRLHAACTYRFQVVEAATKEPIAGAEIKPGWPDIERVLVTDENGKAIFGNLASASWGFGVHKEGYAYIYQKAVEQPLGTEVTYEFALQPGGKLKGRLVDQRGKPVVNCKVVVSHRDQMRFPNLPKAFTDADGKFALDDLPLGEEYSVHADIDSHEFTSQRAAVLDRDSPTVLDLVVPERNHDIGATFLVVDENGESIVGAKLKNTGNPSGRVREGVTDEFGVCRLDDLFITPVGFGGQPNSAMVVFSADRYIGENVNLPESSRKDENKMTVTLRRGKTFKGRIVTPTGEPAAKVWVFCERVGISLDSDSLYTDDQGEFQFNGLDSNIRLTIQPRTTYQLQEKVSFAVGDDEAEITTITLEYTGSLRVRALDATTKEPIPDFNVKLGFAEHQPGDPTFQRGLPSELMANGVNVTGAVKEYLFEGSPIGMPYKLFVSAEGFEPQTIDRAVCSKVTESPLIDVFLQRFTNENYTAVSGELIGPEGPVKGAIVRLAAGKSPTWIAQWAMLQNGDVERDTECLQALKTISDDQGKFRFEHVKRESKSIEIYYVANGLPPQRFSGLQLYPELPETVFDLPFAFASTVQVILDFSRFPEAATVQLRANGDQFNGPIQPIAFDRDIKPIGPASGGLITFEDVPAGDYQVTIFKAEKHVPIGNLLGVTREPIANQKFTILPNQESYIVNF